MEFNRNEWYHVANIVQKSVLDNPEIVCPILDLIEYVIDFVNLDK